MDSLNTVVQTVLSTPELLGLILTPLPFDDLLKLSLVSKFWHATILSTPATQRTLLLLPSKAFISNPSRLNRVSYSYCYSPLNSYLIWTFPLYDPHSPYRQYGCLVPSRSEFGPYTKFPFKSESRSWREMLVLESPREGMVKTLRIQEMVKFRSPGWQRGRLGGLEWTWSRNEDWKWVRNRNVVFEDGLRCGDVWNMVRGREDDEIGGDRTFSLFCRWRSEEKDTVVGMSAQIQADACYERTWKAWLEALCGGDRQKRRTRTWREWFRVLVGGENTTYIA
ncbi:hypothetical protein BDZ45DRAFT_736440 [Acephala macrosclerotiorum]|nr:hypothetical protein BDZ45DRAFT_736440 [Acephala macrosclerotiorum]